MYVTRSPDTYLILYTEETGTAARSKRADIANSKFQDALNDLLGWFVKWKIAINPEKSIALMIQEENQQPKSPIVMEGRNILWKQQAKYLGVEADQRLIITRYVNIAFNKV